MKIPGWAIGAGVALAVALIICNLTNGPKNNPNPAADSLARSDAVYQAAALRVGHVIDSLKDVALVARTEKNLALGKLALAEGTTASAKVSLKEARAKLSVAATTRDSLDRMLVVMAQQDSVIVGLEAGLAASKEAFARLTTENIATIARADSAEAAWHRSQERLGLAERALAIEQGRTGCQWHLILKRVQCPSRGVVAVVALVGGAAAGATLKP